MNILQAIDDENLFAGWFKDRDSFKAWRAFLAAAFGLEMNDELQALYRQHTARVAPPTKPHNEVWLVIGRRGGKSFHMALCAAFLACFRDYRSFLAPGERATVRVMAADRAQARTVMRYIRGLLSGVPMLATLIENETKESIDLTRPVTIEVGTASMRTSRGYTFAAIIADEIAFWSRDESTEPDEEILAAVRPGMASIPGSMLICASSPHARKGALWESYRKHWGKDDAPLVWKASTRSMNPSIPQEFVDAEIAKDAPRARAEYLGEFRSDIEAFLPREAVEACIEPGVKVRAPVRTFVYTAFVDPSGGRGDAMTMAIAHREGETAILDRVVEVPVPFNPEAVVSEFASIMRGYRVSRCRGDRFAGEWVASQFRAAGIHYEPSEKSRSELYLDLLPAINSTAVELLDDDRLVNQLVSLERRTTRGGRDMVDHAPGSHDDIANAAAGALVNATSLPRRKVPIQHQGVKGYKIHA